MSRICFLPLYRIERPSSRYRVFQFIPALRKHGYEVSVIPAPEKRPVSRLLFVPRLLAATRTHDVLFLQKRVLPDFVLYWVSRLNRRIVFDLDDAIYLRRDIDTMLKTAVTVIAGNKALARYARNHNPNVVVIPTVVDTERYKPAAMNANRVDQPVVLGWIGSDPNRGDFAGMKPVLDWLGETFGDKVVFRIVAARTLETTTPLRIEWVPWRLANSISALQSFDIGLMPLPDTEWNRGKCGMKLIQYMAVGATAVASPVGVNAEIIEHGTTGFVADNLEDWQHYLKKLINDDKLRQRMGGNARQRVLQYFSIDAVLPKLINVIRHTCESSNKSSFLQS